MREATVRAHANMALVKYWGKRDEELILPMNSSISMTLDQFYVTTHIIFDDQMPADSLVLNGIVASSSDHKRISKFLDLVRVLADTNARAAIRSINCVPMAAGLSSSSAAYAALASAATLALGLRLTPTELSKLARQGSGSAARSIYGGFVEWLMGTRNDGDDCYAVPLESANDWNLYVVIVIVDVGAKLISSREGMRRVVATSPLYADWLNTVESDLKVARTAIQQHDLPALGHVAEANALRMHATTMGAYPPFTYWQWATVEVIHRVQVLRSKGIQSYATIDAGPNVAVLCEQQSVAFVQDAVSSVRGVSQILVAGPGPGVREISGP